MVDADPAKRNLVAVTVALEQCQRLREFGVEHFHFYTLNRSDATRMIFDSLGIPRHRNLQASSV